MSELDERRAWVRLARVPALTAAVLQPALCQSGSASALVAESAGTLARLGLPSGIAAALEVADQRADADLEWLSAPDHALLTLLDPGFPSLLTTLADCPVALWVRGAPEVLQHPQLAVVGSRHPTATGREIAQEFATDLARAGLAVTSGLALGIDAAAHRGAIAGGGLTIAVCGTGLDAVYPARHVELAAEVAAHGALISDFPPGTPPLKQNFPHRNRLISGLALGTLVVEAAARSGSLITARLAGEQGRELFAIPGSIMNPLARGCHALIRQGARLVESADEILTDLKHSPLLDVAIAAQSEAARQRSSRPRTHALPDTTPVMGAAAARTMVGQDADYARLLAALGYEPVAAETLVERSGLRIQDVSSMLLILELQGEVETYPGGRFCRARAPR
jgi:DNA processing protein